MKLIRLVIDNIASIMHAEIDFATGLLAEEPLFLICGPTGAGKSTILDAVSLALYDTTPRMAEAPGERYDDSAGGFRDSNGVAEPVAVGDTRMLMRRGATSCEIRLTFLDDDEHEFTAVWKCARARKKSDGRMQATQWLLLDRHGNTVCERKRDTQSELLRLTGLTFEQFCRTTMLAQGAFSKFISSSSDEKSLILERLTGTDIYSEISKNIFRRFRTEEERLQQLTGQASMMTPLSDEETAALRNRISVLKQTNESLRVQDEDLRRKINAVDAVSAAADRVRELTAALRQCEKTRDSDEIAGMRRLVSDWDASADGRQIIARIADQEMIRSRAEQRCTDTTLWQRAEDSLMALKGLIGATDMRIKELRDRIAAREPVAALLSQTEAIASAVKRRDTVMMQADSIVKHHNACQRTLAQARAALDKCKADADKASARSQSLRESIASAEKQELLKQLQSNEEKREQLTASLGDLQQASVLLTRLNERVTALNDSLTACDELKQTCGRQRALADEARKGAKEAATRAEEAENLYDRQSVALNDYLKALRAKLHKGDICPLCGSTVDIPADDQSFENLLKPLAEIRAKARAERDSATATLAKAEADLKAAVRAYGDAARRLDADRKTEQDARAAVTADHCASAYLASATPKRTPEALIANEMSYIKEQLILLRERIREGRTIRENIGTWRRDMTEADRQLLDAEKRCAKLKAAIETDTALAADDIRRYKELDSERKQIERELTASIPEGSWRELAAGGQYDNLVNQLRNEAHRDSSDRTALAEAEKTAVSLSATLHSVDAVAREVRMRHPGIIHPASEGADPGRCATLWQEALTELRSSQNIITESTGRIASLRAELESFTELPGSVSHGRMIEIMGQAPAIEPARARVAAADNDCRVATGLIENARKAEAGAVAVLEGFGKLPDNFRDTASAEIKSIAETMENNQRETGEIDHRLQSDATLRASHARLLDQISRQQEITDRWGRLSDLFGSADGKRMRTVAQSYILAQLTVQANYYLHNLSSRYRLRCQPGQLTLLVEDLESGGDIRPASNLSGGESFVVSLALALGLPALSGKAVAFDVIFIDEGFGTLDAETLSTVIDTLGTLHRIGGRRVGVISHVESLRERIPVQIHVRPEGGGRSSVTITDVAI